MSGFQLSGISKEHLDSIHHATLKILRNTGIMIESKQAAEIFDGAGSDIAETR